MDEDGANLRDRLAEIGLTRTAMAATPARHAALRDDPVALALRLFRDRGTLNPAEEQRLFGDSCPPDALLIRTPTGRQARYRLDLVEHLYLFSDWPTGAPDEVLPPGETTAILYRAALSRAFGAALDLGCGSGTLALLLAGHCDRVIATDINPRAISLARRNAGLNRIANVHFRLGSLYEPVTDQKFDLIVSQPPYVPRPAGEVNHLFLHGGERGDELAQQIIRHAGQHLRSGACAFIFSDWALQPGERLRDRLPPLHTKVRLLASPPLTPQSYARTYGAGLLQHFERMRITGIRQCLTVLDHSDDYGHDHGETFEETEVLPHEWAHVGRLT